MTSLTTNVLLLLPPLSCAMHQIPNHPDYFITRLPISTSGGKRDAPPGNFGCSMNGWQLALVKMDDWQSYHMSFVKTIFWPNAHDDRFPKTAVQGGKYVIDSAYDPTVALLNTNGQGDQLWVSFECAGVGFATSSCIGPLVGDTGAWHMDLSRITLVVTGTPSTAASVPKIFSLGGQNFMWFDHFNTANPAVIEARAIELQSDGKGYFWAAGKVSSTF